MPPAAVQEKAVTEVWAYDATALLKVRSGQEKPWQVRPYATWTLKLPFGSPDIGGAAYDPATNLIYLSQQYSSGYDRSEPVIEVFKVVSS